MPDCIVIILALAALFCVHAIAWVVADIIKSRHENDEIERWLNQGEKHGEN